MFFRMLDLYTSWMGTCFGCCIYVLDLVFLYPFSTRAAIQAGGIMWRQGLVIVEGCGEWFFGANKILFLLFSVFSVFYIDYYIFLYCCLLLFCFSSKMAFRDSLLFFCFWMDCWRVSSFFIFTILALHSPLFVVGCPLFLGFG